MHDYCQTNGVDMKCAAVFACAQIEKLVVGQLDRCNSSLLCEDNKGMRSLLLTTIGLKVPIQIAVTLSLFSYYYIIK